MKYNVAFYCQSVPFTDKSIRLETSLGGSESALVMLANALATRDHDVSIFTDIPDPEHAGEYAGVQWYDLADMPSMTGQIEYDIFVSLRHFQVMTQPIRAKLRAVWNQDILSVPSDFYSCLWQTDELYYVSEWQRRQYESQIPDNAAQMGWVTRNCYDAKLARATLSEVDMGSDSDGKCSGLENDFNKIIYVSRPERGLKPLLQMFPKMKAARPDLELHICRYESMYESNPNVKAICDWADRAVAGMDGVKWLGNLNKADLYREIATSALMVYPGVPDFDETSCIAAIEAQALGTPLICSAKGGLVETLHDEAGVKIEGDAYSGEYHDVFMGETLALLAGGRSIDYTQLQRAGIEHTRRYHSEVVAVAWESHWDEYFEQRAMARPQAIIRNLIHHDDFLTAKDFAKRAGLGLLTETSAEIERLTASESPDEYAAHAMNPHEEIQRPARFRTVIEMLDGLAPKRILDFACGNGTMTAMLAERFPTAEVIGVDYSSDLCEIAERFVRGRGCKNTFIRHGSMEDAADDPAYDVIFCGEFLEHNWDYGAVIEALENLLAIDGRIIWTVPSGAFIEILADGLPEVRNHKVHWEYNTAHEVFGKKSDMVVRFIPMHHTPRGNLLGHWLIMHGHGPTGTIDLHKKALTTRPYQSVELMVNTRNSAEDLPRCLSSVRKVVDNIIIGDNGSRDATREVAKLYGAEVIEIAPIAPLPEDFPDLGFRIPPPGDFAWIRNQILDVAHEADWILWLDADEQVTDSGSIRRYLDSPAYNGYVIQQHHLMLDALNTHDEPVRMWRNRRGYKFYGAIHEHCMETLNDNIFPSTTMPAKIAHYGYLTEADRRAKCRDRNMQLLMVDKILNPGRKIYDAFLAREYLNRILWDIDDLGIQRDKPGPLPQTATVQRKHAGVIVAIWDDKFSDFAHPNTDKMWPIYQQAMIYLGIGQPVRTLVDDTGDKTPQVNRFRTAQEMSAYFAWEAGRMEVGQIALR